MEESRRKEIIQESLGNAEEALLRAQIDLVAYEAAGEEEGIDPKRNDVAKWERIITALHDKYGKEINSSQKG